MCLMSKKPALIEQVLKTLEGLLTVAERGAAHRLGPVI
jgi:hypothetical protein